MSQTHKPVNGAGLGLRLPHVAQILSHQNDPNIKSINWFELMVDNWLVEGGFNKQALQAISERYPVVLHGVGLSLGGLHPLDFDYLQKIKSLKHETKAGWYSEHLSFSGNKHQRIPDLLPLPYTEETASYVANRISQVQDFLAEKILIENVSAYILCKDNELSEAEFINLILEKADCNLLLDINNAYVNSINFSTDLNSFLTALPFERIKQIHLAGHESKGDYLLDSHNGPISEPVFDAFENFIQVNGSVPSMVEWDNDLPELEILLAEHQKIAECLEDPMVHNKT